MKFRKTVILVMALFCLFVFASCKDKGEEAKLLWDNYVSAVNSKNHEKIAACYYPAGSSAYKAYVDNEENFYQFDDITTVTTKSFEFKTISDLSSSAVTQLYYSANVVAVVDGEELTFDIYMSKTNENPWVFTSMVYITPDSERLGNLPDDLWLKTALHTYEDFEYRPTYKLEPDQVTYSNISIVNYIGNEKQVTIPDEINGLPVTLIKKFAFAKFGKIFQITYPSSKIRELTIGNNVKTIEEYAFFQSKRLREVVIPANVTGIGEFAFSSSKRLSTVKFMVDDSDLYTEEFMQEIESTSTSGLVIRGARNMYIGDIIQLNEASGKLVTWSVNSSNVASVDADKGTIRGVAAGNLTITCALKSDPTIKATVTITVAACPEKIKVQASAFERCPNLKEMYIYAKNPNSFSIAGTSFRLPSDVKIYVPKGSKEMYTANATWSSYVDNIYEMDE